MVNPIKETLSFHTDERPDGRQRAYVATIKIVVPCIDHNGTTVDSVGAAQEYLSETLRGQVLDWGYVDYPIEIEISSPYVEGTFSHNGFSYD